MRFVATVTVAPDHPALAHHFPGNPIVPGVVILHQLTRCVARAVDRPIVLTSIRKNRFVRPLRGGQTATATFDVQDNSARFTLAGDDGLIASGEFSFTSDAPDPSEPVP